MPDQNTLQQELTELQQELNEVVRHRAAISEVLRAIASSPHDLQPIFDTIIGSATRLCHANVGTLRLCEEKGLRLVARIVHPNTLFERWSPPMLLEPSTSSSLLAHVANRSPIHVPDLDLAHDSAFHRDPVQSAAIKSLGIRTLLGVPMLAEEGVIGVIYIGRVRVQPFTDKEIELIMDFAAQAAIALEITRRERQYREVQMELAHANRVATMGHLTASIAHEVNQPIGAAITYANAAMNWLRSQPPKLDEVRRALDLIVESIVRASDVIDRTRALVKKAPPRKDRVDINQVVRQIIALTRNEMVKNAISVEMQLAETLPDIQGDRVQLQQVILNLVINAIQAMSGLTEGTRELHVGTESTEEERLRVAVRDTGPGLSTDNLQHLFDPFYTTKPNGMGIGLSICRSIIEDHGGRLWATGLHLRGALFQFTIPAR